MFPYWDFRKWWQWEMLQCRWQGDFCGIWSCKNYFWFLGGFLLKYAGMLFWYDEMRWEDMGWGKWKGDFCRISKSRIQRKAYQSRFSWNSQAWNVNLAFSFFVLMFQFVRKYHICLLYKEIFRSAYRAQIRLFSPFYLLSQKCITHHT